MAIPKRKVPKYLDDNWRERIGAGKILDHLREHSAGKREMSTTQVRAAEILLKKVLPDLKAIEHQDSDGNPVTPTIKIQFGD